MSRSINFDITILVILLCLIFFYKSIFAKVILFASYYPCIILCLYKYRFPMKGALSINYNFFPDSETNFAFYSACIAYAFLWFFLLPIRKKNYSFIRLPLSQFARVILTFLYLIFFIISFPRTFGINVGIESGSICLVLSVIILASKVSKFDRVSVLHVVFLLFAVLYGERVDAILALIFHFIIDKDKKASTNVSNIMTESYNIRMIIPLFFFVFLAGLVTETKRMSGRFNTNYIVTSMLTQQTAVDVSFVYLTGVDYYFTRGTDLQVLNNAIFGLFPGEYGGVVSKYYYTNFLSDKVLRSPGGGLYYTEGIIAFGKIGVFLYPLVFSLLVRAFFQRVEYKYILPGVLILIMTLRLQWYGLIFLYRPFVILFIIGWLADKEVKRLKKNIIKKYELKYFSRLARK